jgi:pullulanase/glycogen debranching enzyme
VPIRISSFCNALILALDSESGGSLLNDLVSYNVKDNELNDDRTQPGNSNAYCQDNEINWFDWTLLSKARRRPSFLETADREAAATGRRGRKPT